MSPPVPMIACNVAQGADFEAYAADPNSVKAKVFLLRLARALATTGGEDLGQP